MLLGISAASPIMRYGNAVTGLAGSRSPEAGPVDAPPFLALDGASSASAAAPSTRRPRMRARAPVIFCEGGKRTLPGDMMVGGPDVAVAFSQAPAETGAPLSVHIEARDEDGTRHLQEGTITMWDVQHAFMLRAECCSEEDSASERSLGMIRDLRDALREGIRREMVDVSSPRLREECVRLRWATRWADGSPEELKAAVDYVVFSFTGVDARAL